MLSDDEDVVELHALIVLWFLYHAVDLGYLYYSDPNFAQNFDKIDYIYLALSFYFLFRIWGLTNWARYAYGAIVIGLYCFVFAVMILSDRFDLLFPDKLTGTWNFAGIVIDFMIIRASFFNEIKFQRY